MLVEKNGVKYDITNQAQVDAFLSEGWVEVTSKAKAKEEPTTKPLEEKPVKKATKK